MAPLWKVDRGSIKVADVPVNMENRGNLLEGNAEGYKHSTAYLVPMRSKKGMGGEVEVTVECKGDWRKLESDIVETCLWSDVCGRIAL
jgi:hypothetical protein